MVLRDPWGNIIAEIPDDSNDDIVDTGQQEEVGGQTSNLVYVAPPEGESGPAVVAYVPEDYLNELNVRTVTIPKNFAGMEATAVPTRLRFQFFDIVEVTENEDYVEITALHMFYRLRQNVTLWEPTAGIDYTGAAACRNTMTNQLYNSKFKVASDSKNTFPGHELDYARKNIVETFLDPESGICAKFGLSIIRDNGVFFCLKDVGYDRGFLIENGKNLLGVERKINIENLITRVAPVARDEEGELVWMNRNNKKYIDSTHIHDYPAAKAEVYFTDLQIGENGVTAENVQQKLYEEAQKRFSIDEVDIPEVSMTIQFVSLGDTEEYAQYRDLDKVYLYDIITIKDTIRGYNYAAQVVGVEHNILTGRLESVTIGHLTETDGTRKIATWNVPELNGHKVRYKSIRAGTFEAGSIHEADIAEGAVDASHMSTSANNHFKQIFAEELYISNTSPDGLINTRFTVAEGDISMVIGKKDGQSYIKAAEIGIAINQSTGETEAKINADHIYIGNEKSTTVIAGKLNVSDLTAQLVQSKIADISLLSVQALSSTGGISAAGFVSGDSLEGNSLLLGGSSCTDFIKSASVDNNVLTLTYLKGGTVTFSKATTLTGAWSSGTFTVSASPQGETCTTTLMQGNASWSGKTVTISINASVNGGAARGTGKSVTATYSGSDYNSGWNDCLAACGIAGGGTVFTGTWYGTLYVAPTGGATPVNDCIGNATGHQVNAK